jgi:hypothetical protein
MADQGAVVASADISHFHGVKWFKMVVKLLISCLHNSTFTP